jgi:group I intron endonuclease
MIYNLLNDIFYIGSASTNRINVKFRNHCIHFTGSRVLKKAIIRYGLENFAFLIIKYYPGFVRKENLNKHHLLLLEMETEYIKKLKPEYNILTQAGSSLGYRHTEITKSKMKLNYSQERKTFCKNLNLHKKFDEEKIKLFSKIAKLRNENLKLREQISKKLSKPLILYNIDNTVFGKYKSLKFMAKTFNCCPKTIRKCIKLKSIFKNIGVIEYDNPNKQI